MSDDEKIAELQRQIDELKAEKAKREPKGTDLSDWGGGGRSTRLADQLAIPPEALAAMLAATPPDLMAQLRADARRVTVKSFEPIEPKVKGSGWYEPKPLETPARGEKIGGLRVGAINDTVREKPG